MGHVFYFLGLFVFLANMNYLINFFDFIKIKEWIDSFKKITNRDPTEKDYNKSKFEKFKKFGGVEKGNLIWLFFGLITASWKIFIILISIGILLDGLIRIIGEFKMSSKFITIAKMMIFSTSTLILILNHFHLHMDLFSLLCGFFG